MTTDELSEKAWKVAERLIRHWGGYWVPSAYDELAQELLAFAEPLVERAEKERDSLRDLLRETVGMLKKQPHHAKGCPGVIYGEAALETCNCGLHALYARAQAALKGGGT